MTQKNPKQFLAAALPKTSGGNFSSNWKQLLTTIREEDKVLYESNKKKRKVERKRASKKMANKLAKNNNDDENKCSTVADVASSSNSGSLRSILKKNGVSKQSIAIEGLNVQSKTSLLNASSVNAATSKLSKCVAIDCEFVGVGDDGQDDMVARVSLVNLYGDCIFDKFVLPKEEIVDYRTQVSGIRPEDLINASPLKTVQAEVIELIKGRILVGHAVHKDLKVLFLSHPKRKLRDTSKFKVFQSVANTRRPSLKKLAKLVLGIKIQEGEHDSVTDARVTMQLYRMYKDKWESSLRSSGK